MDWLSGSAIGRSDLEMGHFHVTLHIGHQSGRPLERIEALVDTGATYTWIPRDVLERLHVTPQEDWPFVLADGREVRYPVGWITMQLGDRVQPTIAVFGEPGSEPILGVFALEGFRLAADPVNRRLVAVPGLLKSQRTPATAATYSFAARSAFSFPPYVASPKNFWCRGP